MTILRFLRGRLRRLCSDDRGAISIELALICIVWTALIMGAVDTGRLVLLNLKIDRASSTMADLVAQPQVFDPDTDLASLYPAATRLLEPFDLAAQGRVIVSEILGEAGDIPRIVWQRDGGGAYAASSAIGAEGDVADLPEAFDIVREGKSLVVAEVFYDYEPLFLDAVIAPRVIVHQSFRRPRMR